MQPVWTHNRTGYFVAGTTQLLFVILLLTGVTLSPDPSTNKYDSIAVLPGVIVFFSGCIAYVVVFLYPSSTLVRIALVFTIWALYAQVIQFFQFVDTLNHRQGLCTTHYDWSSIGGSSAPSSNCSISVLSFATWRVVLAILSQLVLVACIGVYYRYRNCDTVDFMFSIGMIETLLEDCTADDVRLVNPDEFAVLAQYRYGMPQYLQKEFLHACRSDTWDEKGRGALPPMDIYNICRAVRIVETDDELDV
eukprot:PhF_6_TR21946/c0_g1_i3/m.31199